MRLPVNTPPIHCAIYTRKSTDEGLESDFNSDRRGWTNKRSTTRGGKERGGRKFDKSSLFKLLSNIIFIGKTRHKGEATTKDLSEL